MHQITGQYTNQWDQPTTVCSCGWVGDTMATWEVHLVEMARQAETDAKRAAAIADAKKALKVK